MSGNTSDSPSPSPGGIEPKTQKCTAGRVKTIVKDIVAQLFSQVGLCLLVIGYSLMGALVFKSLEEQNELDTRLKVSSTRNKTLDDLYDLTGKCVIYLGSIIPNLGLFCLSGHFMTFFFVKSFAKIGDYLSSLVGSMLTKLAI